MTRSPLRRSARRALPAAAAVLLAVCLSGCGADSPSGSELNSGRADAAQVTASQTISAGADLGGMNQQAEQLVHSLPGFAPLTEALSTSATPVARASSTPSTGVDASGTLDGCSAVTNDVLADDLDLDIPEPPTTQPSGYGDPQSTDCVYASSSGIVVVRATTRAAIDVPERTVATAIAQGGVSIPSATRGFAYLPDKNATSGAAVITAVVGERALSVVLTAGQPVTQDEADALGAELVSALQ